MARIRTHPGEILREEFIESARPSANALALRVPATHIGDILRAERPRAVSADTATRLALYFGIDGRILAESAIVLRPVADSRGARPNDRARRSSAGGNSGIAGRRRSDRHDATIDIQPRRIG